MSSDMLTMYVHPKTTFTMSPTVSPLLFNPLSDENFLDRSKLKQIAEDILTLSQTSPGFYVSAEEVF